MLSSFSMIFAHDSTGGIARRGELPWHSSSDMKFFKDKTTGVGNNVVIMGRKTFESLDRKALPNRLNIVISRTMLPGDFPAGKVFSDFQSALRFCGTYKDYERVWVIGGAELYHHCFDNYMYLCDEIVVTRMKTNFECDVHMYDEDLDKLKKMHVSREPVVTRDWIRTTYEPQDGHPENAYRRVMKKILDEGEERQDRTEVGTVSVFGECSMSFDISERCPILTGRQLYPEKAVQELLWMMQGETDSKILEAQGNMFWKKNTTRDELDKRGLKYDIGDIGPGYGFQMRHWGATYEGCDADYSGKGIDQLHSLIEGLIHDPFSRRHILTYYNVGELDKMVLPPCHSFIQFYVSSNRKHLDCHVYMRSADICLGVPYNIAFYGIMTYVIARIVGMSPRKLSFSFGDAHIYRNHVPGARKIVERVPLPWCRMKLVGFDTLAPGVAGIDELTVENFQFDDYISHEFIKLEMAA